MRSRFPSRSAIGVLSVLSAAFVTLTLINNSLGVLPEYGAWTGIVSLDKKLRLLRDFASQGPVDAIIFGPSIPDHGISAEVLSRDLSAAYGKPFRVFNLSVGGAGLNLFPSLYRIARSIAVPKQVWIAFAVQQKAGDDRDHNPLSPDYALWRSPAGEALRKPYLLPASLRLYQVPLVHFAMPLGDLAVHGRFVKRPVSQADVYDNNAFGDSCGYLYYSGAIPLEKRAGERRNQVLLMAKNFSAAADERLKTDVYLSPGSLAAIAELRTLVSGDGGSITILAHDSTAGFANKDAAYQAASEVYFKLLSARLAAPVIDVRESFHLKSYNYADRLHLNANGAGELSALVAARIANRPPAQLPDYAAATETGGPGSFVPVILQKAGDPTSELHLRYVQGAGVPPLPSRSALQLVVKLPDNGLASVPARIVSKGYVVADTSALPPPAGGRALFVQLSAGRARWGGGLGIPLSSYRWSAATQQKQSSMEPEARVSTSGTSFTALERIPVSWSGVVNPEKTDWVGVFPLGGDLATRLSTQSTGGRAAGAVELPPSQAAKPGQYEVRLYGGDLLAWSQPFSITPHATTIAAASGNVSQGARVRATWSKLTPASKDDWIGLFPKGGTDQTRLQFDFTRGKPEGSLDLLVPLNAPPGEYEFRVYSAGGWNLLATSAPFRVAASRMSLTPNRTTAAPGDSVLAKWAGLDSPEKDDWIGLFVKGGNDSSRVAFLPTGGGQSGQLWLRIPQKAAAGEYELRLYAHNTWRLLVTSAPLRVK